MSKRSMRVSMECAGVPAAMLVLRTCHNQYPKTICDQEISQVNAVYIRNDYPKSLGEF